MKNALVMTSLTTALMALFAPTVTQAIPVTSSPITISLSVTSPTCSVLNNNPSIALPPATVGQTVGNYQALNLPNLAATSQTPGFGTTFMRSSATLKQTATISCTSANTPIQSIVIKPGPGAKTIGTADSIQYLVDSSVPPAMAAGGVGGLMSVVAEQLSINGAAAPFAYTATNTGLITPYTTVFNTGPLNTAPTPVSVATVDWQPIIGATAGSTTPFTAATGGSFNGSFQIQINY